MEKLKPCPFCGSTNIRISPYDGAKTIFCMHCFCMTASYRGNDAESKAVAAWNRRTAPENKPLTLKQLYNMDGKPVWIANAKIYGILSVERDGLYVYGEYSKGIQYCWSVKKRGLKLYARCPEDTT